MSVIGRFFLFVLLLFTTLLFGQEFKLLQGKIVHPELSVAQIHIINLSRGNAEVTDVDGAFEISVRQGERLRFSGVQFKPLEIEINASFEINYKTHRNFQEIPEFCYKKISEFPSSTRDFSFSIDEPKRVNQILDYFDEIKDENLKECFMFDFYNDENTGIVKIGYRLVFQSFTKTLKEEDINKSVKRILSPVLVLEGVSIPGMN